MTKVINSLDTNWKGWDRRKKILTNEKDKFEDRHCNYQ
jgi:hypothetical protein